jgi:hypothetical protein
MMRFLFLFLLLWNTNIAFSEETPTLVESQLTSFMSGLRADNPKQAVELWILGMKNRSGAVQFAMLSLELQKQTKKQFEQRHWGTGQSSPWVNHFRFVKVKELSDTKQEFTVTYDVVTSYAKVGSGQKVIVVEKNSELGSTNWFITKITTTYNDAEAFTPAETVNK